MGPGAQSHQTDQSEKAPDLSAVGTGDKPNNPTVKTVREEVRQEGQEYDA